MRLVCPRTTQRVLVVKNLIHDQIYRKNIQDSLRRSRTHESHSFENREISQTYKIAKNQQNKKITEKSISRKNVPKNFMFRKKILAWLSGVDSIIFMKKK